MGLMSKYRIVFSECLKKNFRSSLIIFFLVTRQYEYCDTHDEEQRYWCMECDIPLCSLCLYNDHPQGHRVKSVKGIVQDKREALKEQLDSLATEIGDRRLEIKKHARQLVRVMQQVSRQTPSRFYY